MAVLHANSRMRLPGLRRRDRRGRRNKKLSRKIIVLAAIVALLSAGNVYLYSRNGELDREIGLTVKQCEQKVAELEAGYREEIDDLRNYVLAYYKKDSESQSVARPRFDQLVSQGHRVRAIEQKYDFLLETAMIGKVEKKELLKLLMERERLANLINIAQDGAEAAGGDDPRQLQTDLDNVESRIQVLLQDPLDYQRYEVLRQRKL